MKIRMRGVVTALFLALWLTTAGAFVLFAPGGGVCLASTGSLAVTDTGPRNGETITNIQPFLNIWFSAPIIIADQVHYDMINLERLDQSQERVSITKSIDGNLFRARPESHLTAGVTYRLYVPMRTFNDSAGNYQEDEITLTFTVAGGQPAEEVFERWTGAAVTQDVPLDKEWRIRFNQPVDPASLSGNIRIKTAAGQDFAVVPEIWSGDAGGATVVVKRQAAFAPDTAYTLFISKNLRQRDGGKTLAHGWRHDFTTAGSGPAPVEGITQIEAGPGQAVLIKDGRVYHVAVFYSFTGPEVGVKEVQNLTGVVDVAMNGNGGYALDGNGNLYNWQLDWNTRELSPPAAVAGLPRVKDVAAGGEAPGQSFVLALDEDGVVWAWGANDLYQLGDGTTGSRTSPAPVSGLDGKAAAVSAGSSQSVALMTGGTVRYWGTLDNQGTIAEVPALLDGAGGVNGISAGGAYNLARQEDGRVYIWGHVKAGYIPGLVSPVAMTAGWECYFSPMFVLADGSVVRVSMSMIDGSPSAPETVPEVQGVKLVAATGDAYYVTADGSVYVQLSTHTVPLKVPGF